MQIRGLRTSRRASELEVRPSVDPALLRAFQEDLQARMVEQKSVVESQKGAVVICEPRQPTCEIHARFSPSNHGSTAVLRRFKTDVQSARKISAARARDVELAKVVELQKWAAVRGAAANALSAPRSPLGELSANAPQRSTLRQAKITEKCAPSPLLLLATATAAAAAAPTATATPTASAAAAAASASGEIFTPELMKNLRAVMTPTTVAKAAAVLESATPEAPLSMVRRLGSAALLDLSYEVSLDVSELEVSLDLDPELELLMAHPVTPTSKRSAAEAQAMTDELTLSGQKMYMDLGNGGWWVGARDNTGCALS